MGVKAHMDSCITLKSGCLIVFMALQSSLLLLTSQKVKIIHLSVVRQTVN
jgi:hypothetical protein